MIFFKTAINIFWASICSAAGYFHMFMQTNCHHLLYFRVDCMRLQIYKNKISTLINPICYKHSFNYALKKKKCMIPVKCALYWVRFCSVPAENSLLRYASEDKAPGESFLLGRSLSQNRRKMERGSSPTHYTLVPALQMDVSLSTSSSDSASLYHVSPSYL